MSAGDAREGIIRGKAARARLGGKLAGLSLPRQIAVIAFWPFLEQLLSFFVTSSDLFIATKIGVDAQDTINISDGMGAVVFIMWFGFVIQGSIMMGATAIVSRMTGARGLSPGPAWPAPGRHAGAPGRNHLLRTSLHMQRFHGHARTDHE